MALIVLPEGTQVSGSIGGTTYSRNRYGAYKRSRSVPVNPNSDTQVQVRNALKDLAIRWQNILTQAQRDAWDLYASLVPWVNKLGQSVYLTGLNMYIRSNAPRVRNAIAAVDAAPTTFNLAAADTELSCTASEATQELTLDGDQLAPWVGEADAWYFVFMGAPQNASITFFGGPWKQAIAIPGAGPPPLPATIASPWPFAEGQRIWVRTRVARGDGRLSSFAQVNFLGAA
jgi:hypothetical protein